MKETGWGMGLKKTREPSSPSEAQDINRQKHRLLKGRNTGY